MLERSNHPLGGWAETAAGLDQGKVSESNEKKGKGVMDVGRQGVCEE